MPLSDRFSQALLYALELHSGQTRKASGASYAGHLLRVAGIALEFGADEDEAMAALLHDAVEDQGGAETRREILRRFGRRVAEIVDGCSDTDQLPKPPWRQRKEAFLARLRGAGASIRLVCACDKLDNARSLWSEYRRRGDDLWRHFRGGREGSLWYLKSVIEALRAAGGGPGVEELDDAVTRLERLSQTTPGEAP